MYIFFSFIKVHFVRVEHISAHIVLLHNGVIMILFYLMSHIKVQPNCCNYFTITYYNYCTLGYISQCKFMKILSVNS